MRKPRVLIDVLAYDPRDGGFATAVRGLIVSCRRIEEFKFVIVHHRRHASVFDALPFEKLSVTFPYKMRFFASLLLLPILTRRARVDAVHCEISALPAGVGVPGSVTVHDLDFLTNRHASPRTLQALAMQFYWERIYIGSLQRAHVVKAISQTTAAEIQRLVTATGPVEVVYPFVQPPTETVQKRIWPRDEQPVRMLFLGSVVPRKNLPFLLRALAQFQRDWRLNIVGNLWWGAMDLGRMVDDPRVTLHGYISDTERDRLLDECHILIAPSVCEGFGYPVVEAMSRSMLVLTSDIGAFREYVPAPCRFPLDDPADLADRFNRLDAPTYDHLCQLCRSAVERFSSKANVASHHKLFHRLLGFPNIAELDSHDSE